MAGWYYARDNQAVGPLSASQLKELADAGKLAPTDMVLRAGTEKWVAASAVKGLFPGVPTLPPPLPAEPAGPLPLHRHQRRPYELIAALAVMAILSVVYAVLARNGAPRPGGLLGHTLGIFGFLLMLCTETLYSLRKHLRGFHFGRTSTWLQVHIFTGFVGSYLVLLHGAGKLNGLAGVLTVLTVVMVLSGIVGRYIYTAVPRTLDGVEVAVRDLEAQIGAADRQLQALGIEALISPSMTDHRGWFLVFARPFLRWQQRRRLRQVVRQLHAHRRAQAAELAQLLEERSRLQMQIQSLAATRRLLALWHVIHVPLGVALFALAFIHIGGALYYATFLK